MARRSSLGTGLDSLIPTASKSETQVSKTTKSKTTKTEQVKEVKIEQTVRINSIEPNKNQPRKKFDEDALTDLADSIKQFGVIEPLVVAKRKGYYELIAGERRWRAARIAGLKEVPVVIKDFDDQQIVEIALIENIQREDLNAIEEALAYKRLIDEFNLTQDQVAEKVSKNRSTIGNILRLLNLCDKVQQMLVDEKLSQGHVRTLLSIEDADLQYEAAEYIFDQGLSVRETEAYVKRLLKNPKKQVSDDKKDKEVEDLSFLYKEIENKLINAIGSKTSIKPKRNGKGKIEIEYYSQEELERITQILYSVKE